MSGCKKQVPSSVSFADSGSTLCIQKHLQQLPPLALYRRKSSAHACTFKVNPFTNWVSVRADGASSPAVEGGCTCPHIYNIGTSTSSASVFLSCATAKLHSCKSWPSHAVFLKARSCLRRAPHCEQNCMYANRKRNDALGMLRGRGLL